MNKVQKTQKGITLVALVITIIVLIILAVVAIGALQNHGIINYAKNARADYDAGEKEENSVLGNYLAKLEENAPGNGGEGNNNGSGSGEGGTEGEEEEEEILTPMGTGPWTKNAEGKLVSSDGVIAEIGVTTYTTSQVLEKLGLEAGAGKYNGKWVVLGLDGTNLKLVSQTNAGEKVTLGYSDPEAIANVDEDDEIYNSDNLNLERAIWSWNNAADTLDNAAKAQTGITSARSITAEDLEAEDVLNITEEVKKAKYSKNYGKTYKYYLEDGKIWSQNIEVDNEEVDDSEESWSARAGGSFDTFINWDKKIINSANASEIVKLKDSYYYYNFTSEQSSKFANSLANGGYWLASPCVGCSIYEASFYVRVVNDQGINIDYLFYSDGITFSRTYGVRAVVSV